MTLKISRPDLELTLIEPLLRRTTFLSEVVADLELGNVEVVRERADALHGMRDFDIVTSRAVAPLERLLEWSMPLVAPPGALVALKGSSVAEEIAAAAAVVERFGCATPTVHELGTDLLPEAGLSTTVAVRVAWADPTRVSWQLATKASPSGARSPRQDGSGRQARRRVPGRHEGQSRKRRRSG